VGIKRVFLPVSKKRLLRNKGHKGKNVVIIYNTNTNKKPTINKTSKQVVSDTSFEFDFAMCHSGFYENEKEENTHHFVSEKQKSVKILNNIKIVKKEAKWF
jgi:hypothetical protein